MRWHRPRHLRPHRSPHPSQRAPDRRSRCGLVPVDLVERLADLGLEARGDPPEITHHLAGLPGGVGKALGPEDHQGDQSDHDQLAATDVEHCAGLYGAAAHPGCSGLRSGRGVPSSFASPTDRLRPPGCPGQRAGEHPRGLPTGRAPRGIGARERRVADRRRRGRARPRRRRSGAGSAGSPSPTSSDTSCQRHIPALADLYAELGTEFDLSLDVKDPAAFRPDRRRRPGGRRRGPRAPVAVPPRLAAGSQPGEPSLRRSTSGRLHLAEAHPRGGGTACRRPRRCRRRCAEPAPQRVERRAGGTGPPLRAATPSAGTPSTSGSCTSCSTWASTGSTPTTSTAWSPCSPCCRPRTCTTGPRQVNPGQNPNWRGLLAEYRDNPRQFGWDPPTTPELARVVGRIPPTTRASSAGLAGVAHGSVLANRCVRAGLQAADAAGRPHLDEGSADDRVDRDRTTVGVPAVGGVVPVVAQHVDVPRRAPSAW